MSRDFEFDWDDANRSHLAAHDITPAEFEEVYSGEKLETINERKGETRAAAVGKTKAGRLLTIVYTMRHGKVRPVTAHMIPRRKRKLYEEKTQNRKRLKTRCSKLRRTSGRMRKRRNGTTITLTRSASTF